MDKQTRLELLKTRFKKMDAERGIVSDVIIPVSKQEIKEEVVMMDGFGEFERDKTKHLTSDEK